MNILRTRPGRNAFGRGLPAAAVKVCKTCFESQRTCYCKLMQSKSGMAPKEMKERQNWIQGKFNFFKKHIRYKRPSKPSPFMSPVRRASASAASANNIFRGSYNTDSMEISAIFVLSLVNQQVMDQFAQMKTVLSSFLHPKQETTRITF